MKKISSLLLVSALSGVLLLPSCNEKKSPFAGEWDGMAPVNVKSTLPGFDSALLTYAIAFQDDATKTGGDVDIDGNYNLSRNVTLGASQIKASFSANASVSGIWNRDVDDDDDYLLNLDYSTVKVDIDRNSISLATPDSIPAAKLDSITSVWQQELTFAFKENVSALSTIEDLEVSKDGNNMTFETKNPEQKLSFKRMIP